MRHFTHEEAEATLGIVRPLAERMVACRRRLRDVEASLRPLREGVRTNGGGHDVRQARTLQAEEARLIEVLTAALGELEELGVQVKDVDVGLVDFPALHPGTGETVLLCWHVGEAAIAYWHGTDEGFAGRKPLPFR